MKIGPFGIAELLIILVVVLLIFGPKNLPKLGSALGKTVKNLREGIGGGKAEPDLVSEEQPEAPIAAIEEASDEDGASKEPAKKVVRRVKTTA